VQSKNQGKIMAVSTYSSHNLREFGPLITPTKKKNETKSH